MPSAAQHAPEAPADRVGGPVAYRMAKAVMTPLFRVLFRVRVEGLHHLPRRGPVILAANHLSFMDSLFLGMVTPCPIAFMAKAEYFDKRRTAWIFRATGQIPLRRGSAAAADQAMSEARTVLADGGAVGIYPEGTRSRDGKLHRGKTGPARLAVATGAPIVPVGLSGTDAIQAPGQLLPRPFRTVTIRFGSPTRLPSADGTDVTDGTRAGLRTATDHLMAAIAGLSGQQHAQPRPATT